MTMSETTPLRVVSFILHELTLELTRWELDNVVCAYEMATSVPEKTTCCVLEVIVARTLDTFCDSYTARHAQRLVELAEATALYLHLSREDIVLLRLAALLHDIGKACIATAIVCKPGELDVDEWRTIRRHPEIGRQILNMIGGVFGSLAHIVVAHHEDWDGNGYPVGLAGENIPLLARILAVVDAYDAMTSERPYGRPLSHREACQELARRGGQRYDPRVLTAFLMAYDDLKPITRLLHFVPLAHTASRQGAVTPGQV